MIEEMFAADGERRVAYQRGTDEFTNAVTDLETAFGLQPHQLWKSISTAQYNSIYNDRVVSVINLVRPPYLRDPNLITTGRKFFIGNSWVYDKVYTLTTSSKCTLPYPDGAVPLGLGKLVNVYGQPGDSELTAYKCLYFKCDDHNAVELWSDTKLEQGSYNTFYSATFDTSNGNTRLRMKSYCYDSKGPFTNWDEVCGAMITARGIT